MKTVSVLGTIVLLAMVTIIFPAAVNRSTGTASASTQSQQSEMAKADFDKLVKSLSNWGRWGRDDQLGALNLITPEKRKQAAQLVTSGISISLSRNVITVKIGTSAPFEQRMVKTGLTPGAESSSDAYSVQYHGHTQTHLDALCHFFYQGQMYNGFPQTDVGDKGASKLSVINVKNGIFTRGVILDFPWLFGSKYLKGSRAIYPADLDAWEKKTGVKIRSGDAVFIRTGRWARWETEGEWDMKAEAAGLNVSSMEWFKKRDIAILGSDMVADVAPSGVEGVRMPVHLVAINAMGLIILDNCDLESVGEYAIAHQRWDFLLTVAPLAVETGTGSPVNPTATF
jgi:kynurenine formamidase